MSSAIVGACLVSCFVSIANPWFYTTKCGQNGCPACHKVTERGRADVANSAGRVAQAALDLSGRTREAFERPHHQQSPLQKKSGREKGKDMEGSQELGSAQGSFLGTVGIASHSNPYHGTPPMEIPSVGCSTTGVSFGVDVTHLAPKSDDAVPTGVSTKSEKKGRVEDGHADSSQEQTQTTVPSISEPALSTQAVLDRAISWDRIAGESKSEVKRKWWHLP